MAYSFTWCYRPVAYHMWVQTLLMLLHNQRGAAQKHCADAAWLDWLARAGCYVSYFCQALRDFRHIILMNDMCILNVLFTETHLTAEMSNFAKSTLYTFPLIMPFLFSFMFYEKRNNFQICLGSCIVQWRNYGRQWRQSPPGAPGKGVPRADSNVFFLFCLITKCCYVLWR